LRVHGPGGARACLRGADLAGHATGAARLLEHAGAAPPPAVARGAGARARRPRWRAARTRPGVVLSGAPRRRGRAVSDFLLEELLRAGGVAVVFLAVFGVAELWRRIGNPPAEWTRKLVHVTGGLVSLGLPWLVRSHWTVLALGTGLGLTLLGTRRLGLLPSVRGVARRSEGAVFLPAAIYLVFLLAAERPTLYLISVLTLVVSDALAALVGTTYGRLTYRVERDRRSIEGSVVFFLATFLGVHLPLLLLTDVDRAVSVLVAAQIALLVTILEAVSVDGADNLVVPIGTYLLLLKLTPQPAEALVRQLGVQVAILALLFLLAWRLRLLTASGTLAASIFFYGAWGLGGTGWLVAPAVALAVFGVI